MNDPRDPDLEETNVRLAEGLKACRSIVSDYRAAIAREDTAAQQKESDLPKSISNRM